MEFTSNGYKLSTNLDRFGKLTPSNPTAPINELREQFKVQGYLWLKGLLNRKSVLDFRRRYFQAFADFNLIAQGSDPELGLHSGEKHHSTSRKLKEIVQWAAYESFCLSPSLWQFYEAFFEGNVYLHRRKIVRHVIPGSETATGAHYDLVYLRAGSDSVLTAWIPLGDIPMEMGGLIYLEGSDAKARQLEKEFAEKNKTLPPQERINAFNKNMNENGWLTKDLPALADKLSGRWLAADYEAGDIMVHGAYTIHASTDNCDPLNRIRLSTDIRYQRVQDEIDPRWTQHWSEDDGL